MYEHVLVTVAPNDSENATQMIAAAVRLLGENGRISVLSIVEQVPARVYTFLPEDFLETSITQIRSDLEKTLDVPNDNIHVLFGQPANSILKWAEQSGVDCIVLKSHQPEFADYLLGSTAAKVVRHAKCSVHVIR